MKTDDIKKMGLAYVQVLEAKKVNKHGHDAVGHEDDDIDNDGDTDKSDSYLHNRRKAIKATMKKEEVDIDESSDPRRVRDELKSEGKHKEAGEHAYKNNLGRSYGPHFGMRSSKNSAEMEFHKGYDQAKAREERAARLQKEEVEELDELSKKTLGLYVKKASSDAASRAAEYGYTGSSKTFSKSLDRIRNIKKATDRLTKESTEWPVFARIQEKLSYKVSGVGDDPHVITTKFANDDHTKGAYPHEKIDSKFSQGEKDWVKDHGGHDGNESGIDGHKAAAHTAAVATANVKAAPGRHNDQKVGDKTMPKPKG